MRSSVNFENLGGRATNKRRTDLFASIIDECKLVNLAFNGPKYNWTNKRKTKLVFERLDRGWGILNWITTFSKSSFWHLTRITLDYCHVLLELDHRTQSLGPKPFRFEPM